MIANSHKRSKESKGSITPDFLIMSRSLLYPKILIPMVFFFFGFSFWGFFFLFPFDICLIYVFLSKSSLVSSQKGTIYGTRDCYFQPFNAFWTVLLNPNLSLIVSSLLFAYDSLLYCTFNISSAHCIYAAYYNLIFIRCVLPSRFNHYTRRDEGVIGSTYPLISQSTTFLIEPHKQKGLFLFALQVHRQSSILSSDPS